MWSDRDGQPAKRARSASLKRRLAESDAAEVAVKTAKTSRASTPEGSAGSHGWRAKQAGRQGKEAQAQYRGAVPKQRLQGQGGPAQKKSRLGPQGAAPKAGARKPDKTKEAAPTELEQKPRQTPSADGQSARKGDGKSAAKRAKVRRALVSEGTL